MYHHFYIIWFQFANICLEFFPIKYMHEVSLEFFLPVLSLLRFCWTYKITWEVYFSILWKSSISLELALLWVCDKFNSEPSKSNLWVCVYVDKLSIRLDFLNKSASFQIFLAYFFGIISLFVWNLHIYCHYITCNIFL